MLNAPPVKNPQPARTHTQAHTRTQTHTVSDDTRTLTNRVRYVARVRSERNVFRWPNVRSECTDAPSYVESIAQFFCGRVVRSVPVHVNRPSVTCLLT